MGRCLSGKISLHFTKTLQAAFILIETSCVVLVFHCYCLSQIFVISHLLYFCPVYLYVVCLLIFVINLVFLLYVLRPVFEIFAFTIFN